MPVTRQGQALSMARLFPVIVAANIVSATVLAASVVLHFDAQRHDGVMLDSVTHGDVARSA